MASPQTAGPDWEGGKGNLLIAPRPTPTPRGLGVDSKPELQRVLEHRRRNQLIKKKEEELEAKRLQCPFKQELLRRQQRLNQVGRRYQLGPRGKSSWRQESSSGLLCESSTVASLLWSCFPLRSVSAS